MMKYVRLIISKVGTRERGGLKVGRSDRSRTTWAAVKGPQPILGRTKMEAAALLLAAGAWHHPH